MVHNKVHLTIYPPVEVCINALVALTIALTPSRTFSFSSSLTLFITLPSNLSGWNFNIVSLSFSFFLAAFDAASSSSNVTGNRNDEIASDVRSSTSSNLPWKTGHGMSANPSGAGIGGAGEDEGADVAVAPVLVVVDEGTRSSSHRRSYSPLASCSRRC